MLYIEKVKLMINNCKDIIYKQLSDYIMDYVTTPNNLTNSQVEEYIINFFKNFVRPEYPSLKQPPIVIIQDIYHREWGRILESKHKNFKTYKKIYSVVEKNLASIDEEIYEQINYKDYLFFYKFNFPISKNYNLQFLSKGLIGGILKNNTPTSMLRLYLLLSKKVVLKKKSNIDFWDLYKRCLNILAIRYNLSNNFEVIIKPDELKLEDNYDVYYRYGDYEFCVWNGRIAVPPRIYKTNINDLGLEDLLLLKTNDLRAEFLKRNNIAPLAKFGIVVDSYENYPENESWIKSEYKLIDMHKIVPPKTIDSQHELSEDYTYAPYLYMKNQTTGVYHLEGVNPECKTLYDAIKMRYNKLNIKDYDIKDIK